MRKPRAPAWMPVDYDLPTVAAIKALAAGTATDVQQRLAVQWVIETVAGTYEPSFRSDADGGDRETAFAEGRRFCGLQIVKIINLAPALVAALRKTDA